LSTSTHIEVTSQDGTTKILLSVANIVKVTPLSAGGCQIKVYDRSKNNDSTMLTVSDSYSTIKTKIGV